MIGGSTLAAVLLAAGSTLLRHDNKIRDQIHIAQSELLYFARLRTGLDCATVLGDGEYQTSLQIVVRHLLGAPPELNRIAADFKEVPGDMAIGSEVSHTEPPPSAVLATLKRVEEAVKPVTAALSDVKSATADK
jgi:hypothetical protein